MLGSWKAGNKRDDPEMAKEVPARAGFHACSVGLLVISLQASGADTR